MDGDHKECPIVPDEGIKLVIDDENYLVVTASHDTIQVFPDSRFNHLRYYDADSRKITLVWLGAGILAELVDKGIPMTTRESITETEMECFHTFLVQTAMEGALGGVEQSIDAEVATETAHLDEELRYYMGEWGSA